MRDAVVGVVGTVATFGLSEINLVVAITAGLLTCVYMGMSILKEVNKDD